MGNIKIKFIKAKHPKHGVSEYATVPSRSDSHMKYSVIRYGDNKKVVCNCGDYMFRRPKDGCIHIKLVLGKITYKQYIQG